MDGHGAMEKGSNTEGAPESEERAGAEDSWVYIVRCRDGTLYTGWTKDLDQRVRAHNEGNGAKYTKSRRPVTLVYFEHCRGKREAMRREYQIKQLTRLEKLRMIEQGTL